MTLVSENAHVVAEKFLNNKGGFLRVVFQTLKTPSAKHKGKQLKKITTGVFRSGIEFQNLGVVRQEIADNERGPVGPLPWGEWVEYPLIIAHKGEYYIRLYPLFERKEDGKLTPIWGGCNLEIKYFIDGQPVDKEQFNECLRPSDLKGETPYCFTVRADNVLEMG